MAFIFVMDAFLWQEYVLCAFAHQNFYRLCCGILSEANILYKYGEQEK